MRAGRISKSYKVLLKFDERSNSVFVNERMLGLSMHAGGVIFPSAKFFHKFFKGINLAHYSYGKGYGFKVIDGQLKFDQLYKYRFSLKELKAPLIAIIVENGWSYCPKIWM